MHPPQLDASVMGFEHFPKQQFSPDGHLSPHPPQLFVSDPSVLTQYPPQSVTPLYVPSKMQGLMHWPRLHTIWGGPPGQVLPQEPQLARSFWRSTHFPLQQLWFGRHPEQETTAAIPDNSAIISRHWPFRQFWEAPQEWPQDPQLFGSLSNATHTP
jgi:hypothetical protein